MRLAFLIIAHSEPAHVARLAGRLAPAAAEIIVHVNARNELRPFQETLPKGCRFVQNRVPVTWGTCSLWEAIVSTTRETLKQGNVDRLILLSQSCYPLVSARDIRTFFEAGADHEFIGAQPMLRQAIGRWRLKFNMLRNNLPRWMSAGLTGSVVRRLAIARPSLPWRDALEGRRPYSGTLWWALTAKAAEYVVSAYEGNQRLRDYAQFVFGPEEIIPHTLLLNSPYAPKIEHHVTYEDWSRRGPSPKWLDVQDACRITSQGFRWKDRFGDGSPLFARKFGVGTAAEACNYLDSVTSA